MCRPVGCTICSNVIYCSEACRIESWNMYHHLECAQLPFLYRMPRAIHLALRMLYSAGSIDRVREVARVYEFETGKSQEKDYYKLSRSFYKDPIDYSHVYRINAVNLKSNDVELLRRTINACQLTWMAIFSGFAKVCFLHDSANMHHKG